MILTTVAIAVALINIPFGYWRMGTPKFSPSWFAAVHLPIPLVVFLRLVFGMGFRLSTFPVMVGAYFAGQYFGGRLRGRLAEAPDLPPELPVDRAVPEKVERVGR